MRSHLLSPRLRTVITAYLTVMMAAPILPVSGGPGHGCEQSCVCPHHRSYSHGGIHGGAHQPESAIHLSDWSDADAMSVGQPGDARSMRPAAEGSADCGICDCPPGSETALSGRASMTPLGMHHDGVPARPGPEPLHPIDASAPDSNIINSLLKPPRVSC